MSNEPSEEVGLPHPLVFDDRALGPRRFSDAEMEEIDRLIQRMRRRSDPVNLLFYMLLYGGFLAFWSSKMHAVLGLLVFPLVLALIAFGYRLWEHVKFARFRKELDRAKESRQVIGFPQNGTHYEVLGPRILWTVDGKPSRFRTHGPA